MSLTEILLSLAIMLGVIAGIAVNYGNVKERADEQQVMQGIEMLRSNVEELYGRSSYGDISNTSLLEAKVVPESLLRDNAIKTPWGSLTVEGEGEDSYSFILDNLPQSVCRALSRLSTRSWERVSAGETVIYSRSEETDVTPSTVVNACKGGRSVLTFVGP